jgi:hypothetical protein
MATTAGPSTPLVIPCNASAKATSGKLGQRRRITTLKADSHHTSRDQQSFRPHRVHELAARDLTDKARGAAYGENKPDVFGGPALQGQIGCGDRAKGGLHIGRKKVERA